MPKNFHQPWFRVKPPPIRGERKVVVVGAGLAGCTIARVFAENGWKVDLYEQREEIARAASGNPSAAFLPFFSASEDRVGQFARTAFSYAERTLKQIKGTERCLNGAVQFVSNESERRRMSLFFEGDYSGLGRMVDKNEASRLLGMKTSKGGCFIERAGWIDPRSYCLMQLKSVEAHVRLVSGQRVGFLENEGSGWRLLDEDRRELTFSNIVILASASETDQFEQTCWLPVHKVRGQVVYLPNQKDFGIERVASFGHYILPARRGYSVLGATFDHDDSESSLRPEQTKMLMKSLFENIPGSEELWSGLDQTRVEGRVSFRCMSEDRLPLVGPVAHFERFLETYSGLRRGVRYDLNWNPCVHSGLYVLVGLGARGVLYSELCAQLLWKMIDSDGGTIRENDLTWMRLVHPSRFLVRRIRRGQIGGGS